MQINYVGPKPIISKSGITFDPEHDDRYTYLNIIVQLLQALGSDSFEENTYQYPADTKRLDDNEILAGIRDYCGDLDTKVKENIGKENKRIDNEIKEAKENKALSQSEQDALINNIELMRNYRLQYITNETLYNSAVKNLTLQVQKAHIDYIIVPMFQRFASILHSIQNEIAQHKIPIDTKMSIYEEDGKLMAKLEVKNR
ncbi:hypothetical protein [Sulfurimonas sp. HSL3-7]|uniref:hypothetical protein n=1 Tax=Sulfonitrofixus jiaomeiensis TaxID=3131938 RepID=UPI0031FA32FF